MLIAYKIGYAQHGSFFSFEIIPARKSFNASFGIPTVLDIVLNSVQIRFLIIPYKSGQVFPGCCLYIINYDIIWFICLLPIHKSHRYSIWERLHRTDRVRGAYKYGARSVSTGAYLCTIQVIDPYKSGTWNWSGIGLDPYKKGRYSVQRGCISKKSSTNFVRN